MTHIKQTKRVQELMRKTRNDISIKQYLKDCRNGVDTVKAWNDHKARMAPAN